MQERIRILLADDHETVREGLKAILSAQSDFEVIGEVDSGGQLPRSKR
jgi:DNA-binding NarL/FixJ family response regulator